MNLTIYNKILNNPFITDYDKSLAIKDLKAMHILKHYKHASNYDENETDLENSFIFNKSILGREFWLDICKKINLQDDLIKDGYYDN